jgi:enoyl-CoA hydratase/carnithine racemase
MAAETWFTPAEALAEGLVDEVIEEGSKGKAKAWNLAAFVNAPASPSPSLSRPLPTIPNTIGECVSITLA